MSKSRKQGEQLRNRVLVVLLAAVVVLLAVIMITSPKDEKQGEPPVSTASASPKPESPESAQSASSMAGGSAGATGEATAAQASTSTPESPPAPPSKSAAPASSIAEQSPYYQEGKPMLVNPTNKIPEGYTPQLVLMDNGSYQYDRTANAAYNAMQKAATAEGISLWVVSAYRSHDRQTNNFNNKAKEYERLGNTAAEAYAATARLIAVPGTSEHELGLALDLNSLETSFEQTKAFSWLTKHCAEYGFILRYPKDKVEITQISYEPWHYRYVGSNHAKIIMEKGLCLEEYLSGDYQ